MKRILFTFSLTLLASYSMAQETLSLGQCLQMGIERNLNLKTYEGNVLKGKHNISENRSRLLPQINIGAALNDNFTPPVSVTDGKAYGKPYNVTKTLQYNSSASVQLQMPLYSQTALTALDISKTLDQLNTLSYAKAKEDLIVQISKMYYLAQNTEEQIGIIKDNIKRLEELRDITQAFHDNDMALSVDVKRVNVNLENLSVQYDNAKAMLTQQYNMLKYVIDYPADKDITVTKANVEQTDMAALTGLNENLSELQLLRKQQTLAEQQKKLAKDGDNASSRKLETYMQLMQLIDQYHTHERGVKFYADHLCLSPKYLTSLVKSVSDSSVQQLVFKAITKKAISLITTTDKSIKEIANLLNFPNASAFGTFFKKQVGMSPVNYRQKP